jgi:hypothetical protein
MTPDDIFRRLPAPRQDDVLFRADYMNMRTTANVTMGWSADVLYADGYRDAARVLVQRVTDTDWQKNTLVFPIVYLYRHHIELVLKALTVNGSYLIDKQLNEVEVKTLGKHRLDLLWDNFKPILREVSSMANYPIRPEDIAGIDSYVRQLTTVDPDSQCFRYPTTKTGEPSLPDLMHISLSVFADGMERLADYLDVLYNGFLGLKDFKPHDSWF